VCASWCYDVPADASDVDAWCEFVCTVFYWCVCRCFVVVVGAAGAGADGECGCEFAE